MNTYIAIVKTSYTRNTEVYLGPAMDNLSHHGSEDYWKEAKCPAVVWFGSADSEDDVWKVLRLIYSDYGLSIWDPNIFVVMDLGKLALEDIF